MPHILFQQTNIAAVSMPALNNENPNSIEIDGTFGVIGIEDPKALYMANVIPRTQNVTEYTFELAYYMDLQTEPPLAASQRMWYWSAPDREVVTMAAAANPTEAMRLNGRFFTIEAPAGAKWGYVRISDVLGGGVDLMVWRVT